MATLKTSSAPYQRSTKSTLKIMIELGITLAVVFLVSVITSFIKLGSFYGMWGLHLMFVSLLTTVLCDVLTTTLRSIDLIKQKKHKEFWLKIVHDLIYNYSWITAIIFTLCCPVWTSTYVIILGSAFATLIVKNVYGGFGKNVFNPAAFGRIFIALCFDLSPASAPRPITSGLDVSGATLTTAFKSVEGWLNSGLDGIKLFDVLIGNYFGAMGETCTILLLAIGIYLSVRGIINWRPFVYYISTIAIASLFTGLVCKFDNPLSYTLYSISLGGVMFGAVFMITDPVTTPTSPYGNSIIGVVAGALTFLIRVCTNSAEGVVFSIAVVNLVTNYIDKFSKGKSNAKLGLKVGLFSAATVTTISLMVSCAYVKNGGIEVYEKNGIATKEYKKLVETTNFEFMDSNDYEFTTYKKTLPESNCLYSYNGLQKAYSIIDSSSSEVGVVYCVSKTGINIQHEWNESFGGENVTAIFFVAFDTTNGDILGLRFTDNGVPYIGNASYKSMVTSIEDYDFASNDIYTADPSTIVSGATYASTGMQQALIAAHDLLVSQYSNLAE